jgi:TPR repeat protein
MKPIISLILFYGSVSLLFADQFPRLSDAEKGTMLVLKSYLGETKDSRVPEMEAKIIEFAAIQQGLDDKSRAEYGEAVKRNGGWKLDESSVKQLASTGNAQAQLGLAVAYMVDQNSEAGIYGIPEDEQQSTFWATKAALNGNHRAQWILAMKKNASFDNVVYWLLKVAGHASQRSFKMAAMLINMKARLNEVTAAQLQEESDYQKTLSKVEELAGNALFSLNNIRHGKSTCVDKDLSPEELAIAQKYFTN